MDGERFDKFTRSLAAYGTRRNLLGAVTVGLAAAWFGSRSHSAGADQEHDNDNGNPHVCHGSGPDSSPGICTSDIAHFCGQLPAGNQRDSCASNAVFGMAGLFTACGGVPARLCGSGEVWTCCPTSGQCVNGTCVSCPPDQVVCGPNNQCCPPNQQCINGACCAASQVCTLAVSPSIAICCPAGQHCAGGVCTCATGQTTCGSHCCDSACQVCSDGQCVNGPLATPLGDPCGKAGHVCCAGHRCDDGLTCHCGSFCS
jgi:hypothetical protein